MTTPRRASNLTVIRPGRDQILAYTFMTVTTLLGLIGLIAGVHTHYTPWIIGGGVFLTLAAVGIFTYTYWTKP